MNPFLQKTTIALFFTGMAFLTNAQKKTTDSLKSNIGTLSNLEAVETMALSKEIDMPAKGAIYIENMYGNLIIKTWNQQKVKIATTVSYTGKNTLSSDEWMEKINLSLKKVGNSVKIKSGNVSIGNSYYAVDNSIAVNPSQNSVPYLVFNGNNGQTLLGAVNNKTKRDITITLPVDSKLDIESKYGDVTLPNNVEELTIDLTNGNLDAENMGKLSLRCKYANVTVGDIKNAELEISNGQFLANNISDLDLDSKNSSVEMAAVKNVVIRSTNDEIEMEEVGQLSGRKNYGNLRITQLTKSIDLEGVNADVKIRNVGTDVSLIKLNDRYADIRIPLRNMKNYSVDFTGLYSAVYGSFEKKIVNVTADPNASITVTGTLNKNTASGTGFSSNTNATQPYITSVGSLGNLSVVGTVNTTQPVTHVSGKGEEVYQGALAQGVTSIAGVNNLTITGVSGRIEGGTFVPNNKGLTNINVPGVKAGGNFHGQLSSGTEVAGTIVGGTTPMRQIETGNGTLVASTIPMGQVVRGTLSPSPYITSVNANLNDTPSSFVAKVGDGKGLKVDIKCQNCTVDLK